MIHFTPQWRVMPYDIMGVTLYAVEKGNYTDSYYDSRKHAADRAEELRKEDTLEWSKYS